MQTVEAEYVPEAEARGGDYQHGWREGYDKGYRDAVLAAFWYLVVKDK